MLKLNKWWIMLVTYLSNHSSCTWWAPWKISWHHTPFDHKWWNDQEGCLLCLVHHSAIKVWKFWNWNLHSISALGTCMKSPQCINISVCSALLLSSIQQLGVEWIWVQEEILNQTFLSKKQQNKRDQLEETCLFPRHMWRGLMGLCKYVCRFGLLS